MLNNPEYNDSFYEKHQRVCPICKALLENYSSYIYNCDCGWKGKLYSTKTKVTIYEKPKIVKVEYR